MVFPDVKRTAKSKFIIALVYMVLCACIQLWFMEARQILGSLIWSYLKPHSITYLQLIPIPLVAWELISNPAMKTHSFPKSVARLQRCWVCHVPGCHREQIPLHQRHLLSVPADLCLEGCSSQNELLIFSLPCSSGTLNWLIIGMYLMGRLVFVHRWWEELGI